MRSVVVAALGLIALLFLSPSRTFPRAAAPIEHVITGSFHGAPIVAKTSSDFGGAFYSLTWKGEEFLNSSDHGRELQSASSFDGLGEGYNPTEAGAAQDGVQSTSVVHSLVTAGNELDGETQMAFWRGGLSQHLLRRKVTIGFQGIPNVIQHLVTFVVPEAHSSATFEAVTGYMPPEFSQFYTYDPATQTLSHLSDGPGEGLLPVILATAGGTYAMGVYSPHSTRGGGYGRWRFEAQHVVKWNCVYRSANITPGAYPTECYSIIGSLADVMTGMNRLADYFARSAHASSNMATASSNP
jgi:hypothetical protein